MTEHKDSDAAAVRRFVYSKGIGDIFRTEELRGLAPRTTIDATLSRMVKAGNLYRVRQGVYRRSPYKSCEGGCGCPNCPRSLDCGPDLPQKG